MKKFEDSFRGGNKVARKRVQRAAAALKTKLSFDTAAAAPVSTRTAAGVAAGPRRSTAWA